LDAVEYANRIIRHALLVGVAMAAALGACMLSGASVASLISSDVAVLAAATPVMGLLVLLLPVAAALFSLEGVLIGMNESRYLALASLGSSLVAYAAQLLFSANGSGLIGVWIAVLVFYLLRISLLGYVSESQSSLPCSWNSSRFLIRRVRVDRESTAMPDSGTPTRRPVVS
jgi:Na+-driven multidrug efflux pump